MQNLLRYDWRQSYQWNYDHPPEAASAAEPPIPGRWTYCGCPVGSPLAVAAGPLLNGRWCLYYAGQGFDTLTYKTVRSGARACYPMPNLQPVQCGPLDGSQSSVQATSEFNGSWAVSFGMPSQAPATWQADIVETRRRLPAHKLLSVSVVGTTQPGWSLEQLADDYALCARQAAQHGANLVEINLSCPNVSSCDGQLYQQPDNAAVVARAVRDAIGNMPIIAKIGQIRLPDGVPRLLDSVAGYVDALATTNCIGAAVIDANGQFCFEGQPRGIAGRAILDESVRQTAALADRVARSCLPTRIIGGGGIFSAADVARYLSAGAESVQLATAVMIQPAIGITIRESLTKELAASFSPPTPSPGQKKETELFF